MKMKTKDMILVALFAALTAAGGFISIPIGSVPITLQSFFTLLSGIILGPFLGSLSQLVYAILGLVGVPILAGGTGGISAVFSPSFGYLIGFIAAPLVMGKLIRVGSKPSLVKVIIACILGTLVIYIIGLPYMYIILKYVSKVNITLFKACQIGFLVFIPGDIIKCIIASIVSVKVLRSNISLEY